MVLGGCDRDGRDACNRLTRMCLEASRELKVIDPKINLRVSGETPMEWFRLGSELTAAGLGFPQYSNDDVVIDALTRWGYRLEDARNYVVAACWEFTIPGRGMEVPNITGISLPEVLLRTMRTSQAPDFDGFFSDYAMMLRREALAVQERYRNFTMLPGPFASVLCDGCVERGQDISEGAVYNNFGVHGTGIATAVDSLVTLRRLVFDTHRLRMEEFLAILDENYRNAPELLGEIRNVLPKLGSGDPLPEELAARLLRAWGAAWQGLHNSRGGIWRAGTGSAMYYLRHAETLPATPDGRLANEPFPANYGPSLTARTAGPVSVARDFADAMVPEVCNGGPLTIELHDSVFRDAGGAEKTAELVAYYCRNGGHQLQLNTINRERLLEAQRHPENFPHLIVRVWGWSGYFVELDKEFQDHIIRRSEMTFP